MSDLKNVTTSKPEDIKLSDMIDDFRQRVPGTPYESDSELSEEEFYEPKEEMIEIDNSTGDQKKEAERERERHDLPMGRNTVNKEEYNEITHKRKLKDIRKKAGLLDDPSNYLPIGIASFYAKKKENNLYNFNKNAKEKAKYNKTIEQNAENEFIDKYDKYEIMRDSNNKPLNIPKDKLKKIALMEMQMQQYIDEEIMNLKYPYLN